MSGLEQEYGERINFVRVNILNRANQALLKEFSFSASPELYLVDGTGKIVGFWDDFVEADELRAAFDRLLAVEQGLAPP